MENYTEVKKQLPKKKKRNFSTILVGVIIALIIVLIIVANNCYITEKNEYSVVRQFGEVVAIVDQPGLNTKIPFIQTVSTLPKYTLEYDVPPAEINTLDKKRIVVDYYTLWKITDPKKMIESLKTVAVAESRLGDIIYSNIRTELGRLNYDQIINQGNSARGDFSETVKTQINNILKTNNNGIVLVDIKMKRTDLPAANEQSVYNRMISERKSKEQEYLSQGDAEARTINADAEREAGNMIAIAEREAKEIVAQGEKEAARIYNESYGKDPEFFDLYVTLESYKSTLNGEPVIIIPTKSPYAKYLLGY